MISANLQFLLIDAQAENKEAHKFSNLWADFI
jgi:hypothetical protein